MLKRTVFTVSLFATLGLLAASPEVTELTSLRRETALVENGRSAAVIVAPPAYRAAAERINAALKRRTGAALPALTPAQFAFPARSNAVLIGDRHANTAIDFLYRRHFCLTDRAYPGAGGYELRTIVNPLGDGRNFLLLGGSAAADLDRLPAGKTVKAAYQFKVELPSGTALPPADYRRAPRTWDRGTGNRGVLSRGFGWNLYAYLLALYYQTGDESYAREFLRVAFPDAAVREELRKYATNFSAL